MTLTSVPWRGNERCVDFDALGERLAWYVSKHMLNESRCNWDVRAGDVMKQEAIKPAQTKPSLA